LVKHDLFGKPVSTFPDHALADTRRWQHGRDGFLSPTNIEQQRARSNPRPFLLLRPTGLAAAYAATAANGEIYVLDPANYGSLIITGPVSSV
jgi:hypothetical protein